MNLISLNINKNLFENLKQMNITTGRIAIELILKTMAVMLNINIFLIINF